ncbi:MAG: hypothetical protein ACI8P0_004157, partial [Planctomycetaceae bacterium]
MLQQYSYLQFEGELESIRSAIEHSLKISLLERESSYWGGVYFQFKDDSSEIRLKLHRNINHKSEWVNDEFIGVDVIC